VREEVAGEDNTLFNRTLTAKKEKPPAGKAADLAGPSSLEKLQLVLQKQCDALIGLGFHPTLRVSTLTACIGLLHTVNHEWMIFVPCRRL